MLSFRLAQNPFGAGGKQSSNAATSGTQFTNRLGGFLKAINPAVRNAETEQFRDFVTAFESHPNSKLAGGSVVRFGALYGGGNGAPDAKELELQLKKNAKLVREGKEPEDDKGTLFEPTAAVAELGLSPDLYQMTLEQFRDITDRSFDYFKLGANVLIGDQVLRKTAEQEQREAALSDEERAKAVMVAGYPEADRTGRHTLAHALVAALRCGGVPPEITVLSKRADAVPEPEEWESAFAAIARAPITGRDSFNPLGL